MQKYRNTKKQQQPKNCILCSEFVFDSAHITYCTVYVLYAAEYYDQI